MHYVVDLYQQLSARAPLESVQVLTPMHRNLCGVENLNTLLQARMNPPCRRQGGIPEQLPDPCGKGTR